MDILEFSEGDMVSFDHAGFTGTGTICGKIHIPNTIWIINIDKSNIKHPYSCSGIPDHCVTLIMSRKDSFNKEIQDIKEFYRLSNIYCLGHCTILKVEGASAYSEIAPCIGKNICSQCNKERYIGHK